MIQIEEIKLSDKEQREEFMSIPFKASKVYPHWIPGLRFINRQLLDPKKNPYLATVKGCFFLAKKNGKNVGRVALFGPGHWKNDNTIATLGFIDFPQDREVSSKLFQALEKNAKERGAVKIVGPLNPNIHYDVGILTKGFEFSNAAFLGYNPPFYSRAFEQEGWRVAQTLQSWMLRKENFKPSDSFLKIRARIKANPAFSLRHINIRRFDEEVKTFYDLYCNSFKSHWGFEVPSKEEFNFIAGDLRYLFKPNMGMIAMLNGDPVGFVLGIPNIYQLLNKDRSGRLFPVNAIRLLTGMKKLKTMRIMIAGVLPLFQNKGIHAELFHTFTENLFNTGIESGEIGWVLKGNTSMEKSLAHIGATPVKEYVVYEKEL